MLRPIPRPPPVTSATRSSSLPMCQPWRVTDGSRKAIIAAFFANLGIAIAKFVGFLLTSSAGLLAEAGALARRYGQPGSAAARRQTGPARRPTSSTRSATGASGTSGRSSSPSCCSRWVGCSRSTRASRRCATRTRPRTSRSPSGSWCSRSCSSRTRCARRSRSPNTSSRSRWGGGSSSAPPSSRNCPSCCSRTSAPRSVCSSPSAAC